MPSTSSPSDYLAAERTFLAWIRTGLALMGFGFVVARFGLFLQALQAGTSNYQARPYGLSFWFGTALIVVGVIVNVVSARNHIRLVHELNRGGPTINRPSLAAVGVAAILAVLGLAMAVYLISVREPVQPHSETRSATTLTPLFRRIPGSRCCTPPIYDPRGCGSGPDWPNVRDREIRCFPKTAC